MKKRLTIELDKEVYEELVRGSGDQTVMGYVENLLRTKVQEREPVNEADFYPEIPRATYAEMAADLERERDAKEWIEAIVGEALNEAR